MRETLTINTYYRHTGPVVPDLRYGTIYNAQVTAVYQHDIASRPVIVATKIWHTTPPRVDDGCPTENKFTVARHGNWPWNNPLRITSRQRFVIPAVEGVRSAEIVPENTRGGIVSSARNLASDGCSWIAFDAAVVDGARVSGNAVVENATVSGTAQVLGNASVKGKAHITGDAEITGNVLINGPVTIDSGVWNGWAEFVRPLEEVHEVLFNTLYNRLRECNLYGSESDEAVRERVRNFINLDSSRSFNDSEWAREGPLQGCANVDAILGILEITKFSALDFLNVFNVGKLVVAGRLLMDLKTVMENYTEAVRINDARNALQNWYDELYNNICHGQEKVTCQGRLHNLASQ